MVSNQNSRAPMRFFETAPEADQPAIRVRNLRKSFGNFVALDDVSFDVGNGEFLMIVGPSGCGKTTLLRILAGLETATSGTIDVETDPGSTQPVNAMVFQG